MTVISFSIDEQIKDDVEHMAKEERRSKSDIFTHIPHECLTIRGKLRENSPYSA